MPRRKPERNEPSPRNMAIFHAICEGTRTSADIATEHGVTPGRITQIKHAVETYFRQQFAGKISDIKEKHTILHTHLYFEAMEAWYRSQENAVSESVESGTRAKKGKAAKTAKTIKTTKGQCGDPRFLAQAGAALSAIRKIWGADAPVKVAETNPEGTGPAVFEVVVKSREELRGMKTVQELQRLLQGAN